MINEQLINPSSIVVIGGSNDIEKPGGKILKNLIDGGFKGQLFVINPKEEKVQGIKCFAKVEDLPTVDLAILAIPARFAPDTIQILASEKKTRAFIILSAGFSEESEEGKILEKKVVSIVNQYNAALIGPNCVGIMNTNHHSIFTYPIPRLEKGGVDFISGSGATACFIMEAAIPRGLTFSSVYSVGNSAQMGVEEILEYLDVTFNPENSSRVKLLYIETISKPEKLLKHASSLIQKGCRIAAVKAGSSEAGSRAASSHTGAMASSDLAAEVLFRKAGIVRCYGREDLVTVASIFMHPPVKGKNIAIITHAGGPAVMLTDALSNGGLNIPHIHNPAAAELLTKLFPGSSVANPIDFLATGTAEQLGIIIDYVDRQFDEIDAMVVIFGTPGLFRIFDVYEVLHQKMQKASKPIFAVLPSTLTAAEEVTEFIAKGHINFPDEVSFGNCLSRVLNTPAPFNAKLCSSHIDVAFIRAIIDSAEDGYLPPVHVQGLLDAAGIPRAKEMVVFTPQAAIEAAQKIGFPLVMKVVGPVHKSDSGGVILNIKTNEEVLRHFEEIMLIKDATSVLMQPMLSGSELFVGATRENKFGHMIMCGLGGIFIEVFKDIAAGIAPISPEEARYMIRSLKSYKIIKGIRGQQGINENIFAEIIVQLSGLLHAAPEIIEMDINPLLGKGDKVIAVDARIRIEKGM